MYGRKTAEKVNEHVQKKSMCLFLPELLFCVLCMLLSCRSLFLIFFLINTIATPIKFYY